MLTLHRAYEGEVGEKTIVFYVGDGDTVKRLKGTKALKWAEGLKRGSSVLCTQAHSVDGELLKMVAGGVKIFTAHWHTTGIPKGLAAEEIVKRFAVLGDSILRPYIPRTDLADLRRLVDVRNMYVDHRKIDMLRLSAYRRILHLGPDDDLPEDLATLEKEIATDRKRLETPVDKELAAMAKKIPECVLFNQAAGILDGWNTAAGVVAYSGDMSRFPMVSAYWHYTGYHVVDGHAPKRERGKPGDWSPKLRTVLWMMGTSIIKNRQNRWRGMYESWRDSEMAVHDEKHPKCPSKEGHCGARARRKMVKEILKEFWSSATSGQIASVPQSRGAKVA